MGANEQLLEELMRQAGYAVRLGLTMLYFTTIGGNARSSLGAGIARRGYTFLKMKNHITRSSSG